MIDKLEETVYDNEAQILLCITTGFNNPEIYVLTQNRFSTFMVSFFSDSSKTQIYKMPYRDSPRHEI